MANMGDSKTFHIAMYPWFAMGHLTPFLHFSNKLAERGHRISFFVPTKTQSKLRPFNLHPDLITFIPVTVPTFDGLPEGVETTADVPFPLYPLIMTAMDLTEPAIEASLRELKPHFVFFDFTHWLPAVARRLGMKSIHYCITSSASVGYLRSPERKMLDQKQETAAALMEPPKSFPPSSIKLHAHEARGMAAFILKEFGSGISFHERLVKSISECDGIGFRTCKEIEGRYIDYVGKQFNKPVILSGLVLPERPPSALDEKWAKWLEKFKPGSVIFCAFGSECVLKKSLFQELVLGLELTGMPFFAAVKPPVESETMEQALPEGFEQRVEGRGIVYGGWVQQPLLLGHPSVGCFVTHCGSGSLSEAMVNECQLVLLPNVGDQIINARVMSRDLKVGVEVEKGEEDGLFSREGVCKAVRSVMDDESEIGSEVRKNHAKWRELLLKEGLDSFYIDSFVQKLQELLG